MRATSAGVPFGGALHALSVVLVLAGGIPEAAVGQSRPRAEAGVESLTGRAVDAETGRHLAGAEIRVGEAERARAVSGPDGRWTVAGLPPGSYRVEASHLGYVAAEATVLHPSGAGPVELELRPTAISLDALVVTASRRSQRLADVPITTEVVGRRDVTGTGATDVASVLVERTGIQLSGGHPSGSGIMLQGMDSERVQVLLDGQPVSGRLSGTLDLSRIPSSVVERIEVVKGPQSTLYGSEAMGGVVNLITRAPPGDGWNGSATVTGGTLGRLSGSVEARGGRDELSGLVQGGYRQYGLVPGQPETEGAAVSRWDGMAKLRWDASPTLSLGASGLLVEEDQRWQSGQLHHFADNRQVDARLEAEWTAGAHQLLPTLHLSRFEHLSRRGSSETPPPESTGRVQLQQTAEAELLYHWTADEWSVDAGVEASRDLLEGESVQGQSRDLSSIEPFAQIERDLGMLTFFPGVRYSWSREWGGHWTPRLAVAARPAGALALRASVARGFRAPGFKELYQDFLNVGSNFGYRVRGNPDLNPEESTNVTASVEWTPGSTYLRLQAFDNRFDDFIETRAVGDSSGIALYTYGNVSDGYTRGAELEGGVVLRGVRAEVGYAHLVARGGEGERPLLGRPRHSGRLNVTGPLPAGMGGSLTAVYTGRTPMALEGESVMHRRGFPRVDLRVTRFLGSDLQLALGVDNVLDEIPEAWPGYAGRRLYSSVTVTTGGGR
ncbi:MAG: TonB-dependent receptor domain-containing protein [Longimicrobiales bacterium]